MEKRIVGQTKTAGFQIGVRRTHSVSQEKAWEFLISEVGLRKWLGVDTALDFQPGEKYQSDKAEGEIRIVKPHEQLRLTWRRADWEKPSTVQIRIIPKDADKTTISFHQENMSDENVREEMKEYWEAAQDELKLLLSGGGKKEISDLPAKLAKPAKRALEGAGYFRLEQLTHVSEAETQGLHGMGPKALEQIRHALEAKGLSFAKSS